MAAILKSEDDLTGEDWNINAVEESYEPGVADFNGNIQMPLDNVDYMLVNDSYYQIFKSQNLSTADQNKKISICLSHTDESRKIKFENMTGGYFRVNSADRFLTLEGNNLNFREEIHQEGDEQLFRIIINPGGTITIMSKEKANRVLRAGGPNKDKFRAAEFSSNNRYQRFFLRTECVGVITQFPDQERTAYYGKDDQLTSTG